MKESTISVYWHNEHIIIDMKQFFKWLNGWHLSTNRPMHDADYSKQNFESHF